MLGKDVLDRLRECVIAHIEEPIEVAELANLAACSPLADDFCSRCHSKTGTLTGGGHGRPVKVHMTMTDRMVDLVGEGMDLAIRTTPIPDSNLIIRRVGVFRLLVCGAPSYLASHGVPRAPSDLANHTCLRYTFSSWGSDWRFATAGGDETVHIAGNLESNSPRALTLAAVHGQGLILMPDFLVRDEIVSGDLVPLLTDFCIPEKPINAVYPHHHHLSANVRSFLELVTKRMRALDGGFPNREAEFAASPLRRIVALSDPSPLSRELKYREARQQGAD